MSAWRSGLFMLQTRHGCSPAAMTKNEASGSGQSTGHTSLRRRRMIPRPTTKHIERSCLYIAFAPCFLCLMIPICMHIDSSAVVLLPTSARSSRKNLRLTGLQPGVKSGDEISRFHSDNQRRFDEVDNLIAQLPQPRCTAERSTDVRACGLRVC